MRFLFGKRATSPPLLKHPRRPALQARGFDKGKAGTCGTRRAETWPARRPQSDFQRLPIGRTLLIRPIGLRNYQPYDSLRHIHWKASARCQGLQVKVFEPTATLEASLFFGVDSYRAIGEWQEEEFEWGISLAASVANHLVAKGVPTGLFSNGRLIDSGQAVQIPPGGSREQILMILEALAKLTSEVNEPLDSFLQRERRTLAQGSTLVFILRHISNPLIWQLQELKEAGYKLAVLLAGDQETSAFDETVIRKWKRPPAALNPFSPGNAV